MGRCFSGHPGEPKFLRVSFVITHRKGGDHRVHILLYKRAILFLSSPKLLTPHPPLRPASVYPPPCGGGGQTQRHTNQEHIGEGHIVPLRPRTFFLANIIVGTHRHGSTSSYKKRECALSSEDANKVPTYHYWALCLCHMMVCSYRSVKFTSKFT